MRIEANISTTAKDAPQFRLCPIFSHKCPCLRKFISHKTIFVWILFTSKLFFSYFAAKIHEFSLLQKRPGSLFAKVASYYANPVFAAMKWNKPWQKKNHLGRSDRKTSSGWKKSFEHSGRTLHPLGINTTNSKGSSSCKNSKRLQGDSKYLIHSKPFLNFQSTFVESWVDVSPWVPFALKIFQAIMFLLKFKLLMYYGSPSQGSEHPRMFCRHFAEAKFSSTLRYKPVSEPVFKNLKPV